MPNPTIAELITARAIARQKLDEMKNTASATGDEIRLCKLVVTSFNKRIQQYKAEARRRHDAVVEAKAKLAYLHAKANKARSKPKPKPRAKP